MIDIMNSGCRKDPEYNHHQQNSLDPQLWHACAGGMVQMPPLNSKVIYFPQGHIEHAQVSPLDLTNYPPLPSLLPCRVSSITYLADRETDEVFAKIGLIPDDHGLSPPNNPNDPDTDVDTDFTLAFDSDKHASFAKTLTQSDANNGGGFSVPRYCAETIFPRLDYSAEPPVQTILARDVHGVTWKFRHIYRGTPRRHLLTTGWSNFVNQKKLVAGDSIVFLRAANGDLCVGIRRAKKGIGGGPESPSSWWNGSSGGGGYTAFLKESNNGGGSGLAVAGGGAGAIGKMGPESVIEAANRAATGKPFEVVYYPRASTPQFCVKESAVRAAMRVQWCSGMRFKMAFETEDSSRISWFMGTISAVQVAEPIRWPGSPWRLLQVAWDEPDLLQNVKRVNPWLVEMVSSMPSIHMSLFSMPSRKKIRPDSSKDSVNFPSFIDTLQMPVIPPPPPPSNISSPLKPPTTTAAAAASNHPFANLMNSPVVVGIQGARHTNNNAHLTKSLLPDYRLNNCPQFVDHPFASLLNHHYHRQQQQPVNLSTCHGFPVAPLNFIRKPSTTTTSNTKKVNNEDISCLLTMGSGAKSNTSNETKLVQSQSQSPKRSTTDDSSAAAVTPKFKLFGKAILTEEQISQSSSSGDSTSGNCSSSNRVASDRAVNHGSSDEACDSSRKRRRQFSPLQQQPPPPPFDAAHCKGFMELEDVGRKIDLPAVLGS